MHKKQSRMAFVQIVKKIKQEKEWEHADFVANEEEKMNIKLKKTSRYDIMSKYLIAKFGKTDNLPSTKEEVREIGKKLIEKQIEIRPGFWPLGDMEYLNKYKVGEHENGNYIFEHIIVLPSSVRLAQDNFEGIKEIVKNLKELI